jgi:hypothetical protein
MMMIMMMATTVVVVVVSTTTSKRAELPAIVRYVSNSYTLIVILIYCWFDSE